MATIDKRGARVDLKAIPSSGIIQEYQLKESGSVVDITGYSFAVTVSDDDGETGYGRTSPITVKEYSGVITDAANGKFTVTIPASDLANLWGEQIIYGITSQPSGGDISPFVWGRISCEALS